MEKYNVLITGTGGGGVGEGIYKALIGKKDYNLYVTNNTYNSMVLFNDINKSFIVPSANDSNYCDIILKICHEKGIQIIIPGSEQELVVLVNNRSLFDECNIVLLTNTGDVINTFNDKWETFKKLHELGIKTPYSTIDASDDSFMKSKSFPYVIKPTVGNASKNVFIVNSKQEFDCITAYMNFKQIPFVIQEHVGTIDTEYTISVISDLKGEYLGSIVLKRTLSGGYSQFVVCEKYSELDKKAQQIARKINSKGPLNLQCRIHEGELFVFEINPRFSGTTPFRADLGFNEVDILIKKIFRNENIFDETKIKYNSFGIRGFNEVIIKDSIMSEINSYKN